MSYTTYKKINSVTVASTAAAIEFTSIPADYTDLLVLVSTRTNEAQPETNVTITFNGSTSNESARTLYGNGTSALSYSYASDIYMWTSGSSATTSAFGSASYYIPNYAGSTNKSLSIDSTMESNVVGSTMALTAGLWSDASAITSLKLTPGGGSFVQHSSATLYGIRKY